MGFAYMVKFKENKQSVGGRCKNPPVQLLVWIIIITKPKNATRDRKITNLARGIFFSAPPLGENTGGRRLLERERPPPPAKHHLQLGWVSPGRKISAAAVHWILAACLVVSVAPTIKSPSSP
jgi:hypothetical protein